MTRSTAAEVVRTSRTSSDAGRPAPASMSPFRCSNPPGYWSRSSPCAVPSNRHTTLSALRAMWVRTWPTLHPGRRLGPRRRGVAEIPEARPERGMRGHTPVDQGRGWRRVRRGHAGGMVDCPSSMSAMTARMNSSASSVMPPDTPP